MAIAASGTVSAADIRTEYGLSGEVSFADLYRGGSYVRAKAANNNGTNLAASVPTSGTLTFDNFRGTAKAFKYTFTGGATNQNASTLFGDDYAVNYPKEIIINAGVELGATSTSEEALEIPSGGAGSITITNNGTLSGAGGAAGGGTGGDAFEAAVACILVNNGTIRAGGGGGGAGGTGGQGSYSAVTYTFQNHVTYMAVYAFGCRPLVGGYYRGSHVSHSNAYGSVCPNGYGYYVGSMVYNAKYQLGYSVTSYTSGGSGGSGGKGQGYVSGNASGSGGSGGGTNAGQGGQGGVGGTYGNSGSTGSTGVSGNYTGGSGGSSGGAAGKYIRGISFVTYTNNGSNLGGTA
jgi:hypothetical protein